MTCDIERDRHSSTGPILLLPSPRLVVIHGGLGRERLEREAGGQVTAEDSTDLLRLHDEGPGGTAA